ncbi:MAG: cytochrome c3 family protein, partial [Saprospiraceae bacterium]|nr:cytochrome c3 family protein [Saprospiraceae bacterium]
MFGWILSMKRPYLSFFIFFSTILFAAVAFAAAEKGMLLGSHGDKELLPRSCQACHRGMSIYINGEENSCVPCHGSDSDRNRMSSSKHLRPGGVATLKDIVKELRKPYRHPVFDVRGAHRSGEILPEELINAIRHSECVDCHNPHVSDQKRPLAGIQGRRVGNLITEIVNEYELCFKCHSISANLPQSSTNKAEEFRTTNPSFHPVLAEGKQAFVVSLKEPYA